MRTKSYFSGTVEAAIALARRELGEDTLLLSSRPATPEVCHLGAYEVVFGVEDDPAGRSHAISPATEVTGGELFQFLSSQDFDPFIAREIEQSIGQTEASEEDARQAIAARFPMAAERPDVHALIFVGPPGAGKTTTLMKLAIRKAMARAKPVRILSLDSRKLHAASQLQRFAALAGIPFDAVATPDAALTSISSDRANSLFLVDTPGFAPAEMLEARNWAAAIEKIPHREVHLVVTANTRTADLARTAERYRMFSPQRFVFTRLDEASTAGGTLSLPALTGLPASWFGTGQSVPEDLEPANSTRPLRTLFASEPKETEQALAAFAGKQS